MRFRRRTSRSRSVPDECQRPTGPALYCCGPPRTHGAVASRYTTRCAGSRPRADACRSPSSNGHTERRRQADGVMAAPEQHDSVDAAAEPQGHWRRAGFREIGRIAAELRNAEFRYVPFTARLRSEIQTDDSLISTTITSKAPIIEEHVPCGRWHTLEGDWWETGVVNCQLCGQVIPRDAWKAEDGGTFCSTSCDGLFHGYFKPRLKATDSR